jgi:hypothetical protein
MVKKVLAKRLLLVTYTPFFLGRAISSVVEHYLHTVGVAGSKPASRTSLWHWLIELQSR